MQPDPSNCLKQSFLIYAEQDRDCDVLADQKEELAMAEDRYEREERYGRDYEAQRDDHPGMKRGRRYLSLEGTPRCDPRFGFDKGDPSAWSTDELVSVFNGEVTLPGQVSSRQDIWRAENCVDAVSGVLHVQSNSRVRTTSGPVTGSSSQQSSTV
ncbi:BON domain-containing protein [Ensifer sp. NM-2]|jgi:hypothetical protein|nr:BON domain-containing protein [Ensifer sp. NM-2]